VPSISISISIPLREPSYCSDFHIVSNMFYCCHRQLSGLSFKFMIMHGINVDIKDLLLMHMILFQAVNAVNL
jgi:hypothetical protein